MNTISISLVSHTNAGKTALARTLLVRDVGTVSDAPHVTEFADVFNAPYNQNQGAYWKSTWNSTAWFTAAATA